MKPKIVSLSGGRTSAYLADILEADEYVFCDTGAEDQATYDFIREFAANRDIKLTCLRVEINPELGKGNSYKLVSLDEIGPDLKPWRDMVVKYGDPAINFPFCTARMKTEPCEKYLKDQYGDHYELYLGMRYDEPKRLWGADIYRELVKMGISGATATDLFTQTYNGAALNTPRASEKLTAMVEKRLGMIKKKKLNYLANISDFEKKDVLRYWSQQPFDLQIEEHLGNCVFCIKKGESKLALAIKDRPDSAIKFIELTEGDEVRTEGRKIQDKAMYRDHKKLSDIAHIWKTIDRDEIYDKLRFTKSFNAGSCSESCEAFNLEFEF